MSKRTRLEKDNAGPCPIMRACGGCAWLGVPYKKQLKRKQAAMEELFRPLLDRFGWDVEIDPIRGMGGTSATEGKLASPRAFRYKATTPFAPLPDGRIACGFYAAGTHRIVPAADCAVEAPEARRILNDVARVAESLGMRAYDEDTHRGLLRHAVVRLGWRTDEGMLTVVTANRGLPREQEFARELLALSPRITCVAQNVNPRPGNAILGPETRVLAGEPCMHDELLGCTFAISPTSFYQTNPQQTEMLYQLAIDGMALRPNDILVDAYCGSGTIGLCAAHAAAQSGTLVHLLGIEQNESGVADARLNARLNGLTPEQATFVAADATAYLRKAAGEGARYDVVALDPPRAGSTPAFLEAAMATQPRRIVYISCNPVTQARDLEVLGTGGYRLLRLTPVDMFPHTEHVETVAVLERT